MPGQSPYSALAGRIRTVVAGHEKEIREFTAALVAIPTENPPGKHYGECARLIARKLKELCLPAQLVRVPLRYARAGEPRWCVLSSLGDGRRTLYFHGHYDVVPAANPRQFQAIVKNGVLSGRGSADMKCGIAAMIYAMAVIRELRVPLDGKIALVLVPDEETGGASIRRNRWRARSARCSPFSTDFGIVESASTLKFFRKSRRQEFLQTNRWRGRWPRALAKSPATPRSLKCVPACSKSGSMRNVVCLPTRTARENWKSRTVRPNPLCSKGCTNAARFMRSRRLEFYLPIPPDEPVPEAR